MRRQTGQLPAARDDGSPEAAPGGADVGAGAPAANGRLRIAPSSIVTFCVVFWAIPLLGLLFTQYINILLVIFLAVLISTFLSPAVHALERLHIHRGVGVLLIYLLILVVRQASS